MIRVEPDPILRQRCAPVTDLDAVAEIVADLRRALDLSPRPGLALAAPQIGIPLRVFVAVQWPEPFVNPTIVQTSIETEVEREGCLSLPADVEIPVRRFLRVKTHSLDSAGEPRTRKHRLLDARVVQHEIDHLDGILVTDREYP